MVLVVPIRPGSSKLGDLSDNRDYIHLAPVRKGELLGAARAMAVSDRIPGSSSRLATLSGCNESEEEPIQVQKRVLSRIAYYAENHKSRAVATSSWPLTPCEILRCRAKPPGNIAQPNFSSKRLRFCFVPQES